jgi:hypothetical protein
VISGTDTGDIVSGVTINLRGDDLYRKLENKKFEFFKADIPNKINGMISSLSTKK